MAKFIASFQIAKISQFKLKVNESNINNIINISQPFDLIILDLWGVKLTSFKLLDEQILRSISHPLVCNALNSKLVHGV